MHEHDFLLQAFRPISGDRIEWSQVWWHRLNHRWVPNHWAIDPGNCLEMFSCWPLSAEKEQCRLIYSSTRWMRWVPSHWPNWRYLCPQSVSTIWRVSEEWTRCRPAWSAKPGRVLRFYFPREYLDHQCRWSWREEDLSRSSRHNYNYLKEKRFLFESEALKGETLT